MNVNFRQLNHSWNADPNAPEYFVEELGTEITFNFALNVFQFDPPKNATNGLLTFTGCSKYRLGDTNDEGFFRGQCRFSKLAPSWGEFFEVSGDKTILNQPDDWKIMDGTGQRHFLFYLRDETFECQAHDWSFEYI